nr:hypothetical protein Itr_chr06CG05210 [Ipomoea trifida]
MQQGTSHQLCRTLSIPYYYFSVTILYCHYWLWTSVPQSINLPFCSFR